MARLRYLFAILLVVGNCVPIVFADPSAYLCVVEKSAGLFYSKKENKWSPTQFKSGKEYTFRKLVARDFDKKYAILFDKSKPEWAFFDGPDNPIATCSSPWVAMGLFSCSEVWKSARFDPDSRRFELVSFGGYTHQGFWLTQKRADPEDFKRRLSESMATDPENPPPLQIEIGTCRPDA